MKNVAFNQFAWIDFNLSSNCRFGKKINNNSVLSTIRSTNKEDTDSKSIIK
jgi:hypothetical protein